MPALEEAPPKAGLRRAESGGSTASGASLPTSVGGGKGSIVPPDEKGGGAGKPIPPPVLVYHESARSIVFRDHLRRQASAVSDASISSTAVAGSATARGRKLHSAPPSRSPSREGRRGRRRSLTPKLRRPKSRSRSASRSSRGSAVGDDLPSVAATASTAEGGDDQKVVIAGYTPEVMPLERLELGPNHEMSDLIDADPEPEDGGGIRSVLSLHERDVADRLASQTAVVKTVRNADWTAFLKRFRVSEIDPRRRKWVHVDKPGLSEPDKCEGSKLPFNSFVTSTTLLPSYGKKMRCFGSTKEYTVGVVFALPTSFPTDNDSEDNAVRRTKTWSWPAGYSAKTEFNIDARGNLINGREEALVPLSGLRKLNHSYLHDQDYEVGGRIVKGGLNTVPYNEVYVRVGGPGRAQTGEESGSADQPDRPSDPELSLEDGVGLPIALFVRTACYGHLIALLRARARLSSALGKEHTRGIPLLMITPERGVRVLTEPLQKQLLQTIAHSLNPFQNPMLQHRTTIDNTSESHMQQKLEELIDLDSDNVRNILTPEECARIAGGFGATDDSVAHLLVDVMQEDRKHDEEMALLRQQLGNAGEEGKEQSSHKLQDIVNDGLTSAVRSGDYNTARQLLILYTLVASKGQQQQQEQNIQKQLTDGGANQKPKEAVCNGGPKPSDEKTEGSENRDTGDPTAAQAPLDGPSDPSCVDCGDKMVSRDSGSTELSAQHFPPPPPPPPLDTDRLRSATNSDGLLAVLGAAQVLKAMQDGGAKRRVEEAVLAMEEWVENGEQSVAFRLASWRDQRAAQGDLKIATEQDTNFMAFISNKAISNRKKFAKQLRDSISATDFENIDFLHSIHGIVSKMRSPCLRLELLQYILGLDNRYSVAHVARSVELAATCMNISASEQLGEDVQEGPRGKHLLAS